jgi:NADPH-dependent 2,4-dienoyl-CoA reductase/sulfur reductase-like enzyme
MSRGSHTTRVLLSSVLAGETAPEDIELKPMSWWRNQGVTLKVGCPATEIDVGRREIKIANDESVSFSRLVPAAGSAPLRLNVPAADLRANCSIPPISSQAQGAASLECPPTFSAPHRRGDRIGWLIPVMAPSVTAEAQTAFPELRADRPYHQPGA